MAALWLVRNRDLEPARDPAAAAAASASAPIESPPPGLTPEEEVGRALAEAPLLDAESARALLTEAGRRGLTPPHALDHALLVSSTGFTDLDQATLDELGALFAMVWSTSSAVDQRRIQAYVQNARTGEPLSPELAAAGRELFAEGVRKMPAPSRARLTALFCRAIAAGIDHQRGAEERAVAADLAPVSEFVEPPSTAGETPPSTEPSSEETDARVADETPAPDRGREPAGASDTAPKESYWRSRANQARSRIAAAERRVRELEEKAVRGGPLVAGPLPPACQAGVTYLPPGAGLQPVKMRDESRNAVRCDSEILRQQEAQKTQAQLEAAREGVKAAEKAFEDLEEEARRAGALPGWLR